MRRHMLMLYDCSGGAMRFLLLHTDQETMCRCQAANIGATTGMSMAAAFMGQPDQLDPVIKYICVPLYAGFEATEEGSSQSPFTRAG